MTSQALIAGIGSPHGDDRVGWEIIAALESRISAQAMLCQLRTPAELLDWIDDVNELLICDACRGAGEVGSVHQWEWPSRELEALDWSGTHNLSLPAVLTLAERLGRLPTVVQVWGVEVQQVHPEQQISEKVNTGAKIVTDAICQKMRSRPARKEQQHA